MDKTIDESIDSLFGDPFLLPSQHDFKGGFGFWVPISFSEADTILPEQVVRIKSRPNNLFYIGNDYGNKTNVCHANLFEWEKTSEIANIHSVYFYCDGYCCHLDCCQLNISLIISLLSLCMIISSVTLLLMYYKFKKQDLTWNLDFCGKRHRLERMNATRLRTSFHSLKTPSIDIEGKSSVNSKRLHYLSVTNMVEGKRKFSCIEEESEVISIT